MLIVFKAVYLLDDDTARIFWSSLMASRPQEAQNRFVEGCKILLSRVDALPDQRSREIFGEALLWVIANPEAINLYSRGRMRYSHLPNYVGFINLLSGVESWSAKWQSPVRKIFHDRQSQFEKLFADWHQIFSNAPDDEVIIPGDFEPMVLRKVFGSELIIKNSADSAGIQVVDLVLWLINRTIREDRLGPGATYLLSYILRHSRFHRFSFAGAIDLMKQLDKKYPKFEELDEATMKKVKEIQATMEQTRQNRMLEYSQQKLVQSTADEEN